LFRVVVAPSAGLFQPAEGLAEGADVRTGQTVGRVVTRQGPVEITAHAAGLLTEWLAHHDDPVAPGQPVARIGGQQQ
jgi:[acyl-carrier-protein] S-malonyltransferase